MNRSCKKAEIQLKAYRNTHFLWLFRGLTKLKEYELTSGQKFSVSLLFSVAVFAVFTVLVFSGHFGFFEAKFYQPAVRHPIEQKAESLAELEQQYTQILIERFLTFTSDDSVRSFTMNSASSENVKSRLELIARLFSSSPGLLGIRIIGVDGKKVYYSTFSSDIKSQSGDRIVWRDYADISSEEKEVSFNSINCPQDQKYSIFNDEGKRRIVYSVPFLGKDRAEAITQRALAVFYYDASDFPRFLFSMNAITLSEKSSACYITAGETSSGGYIFGLPVATMEFSSEAVDSLKEAVRKNAANLAERVFSSVAVENIAISGSYSLVDMKNSSQEAIREDKAVEVLSEQTDSDDTSLRNEDTLRSSYNFVVFTKTFPVSNQRFFISLVYDSKILEIPDEVKILLLLLLFITVFLIVFLLFNIKKDDMAVIKDRIKRFQLAFITECMDRQDSSGIHDLRKLGAEITDGRKKLNEEIRKSLGRRGKRHGKEVDSLLESSWGDILSVLGIEKKTENDRESSNNIVRIDNNELRNAIEEIVKSGVLSNPDAKNQAEASEAEPVEELDDADEVESADDIASLEEAEASEVEPVEELDDAGETEDGSDLAPLEEEEASEAEPVEELDDAGETEDVDDIASIEETEASEAEPEEQKKEFETVELSYDTEVEDNGEGIRFGSAELGQNSSSEYNKIVDNFEAEPIDFSFLDKENFASGDGLDVGESPLRTDSLLAKNIDVSGAVDIIPDKEMLENQSQDDIQKPVQAHKDNSSEQIHDEKDSSDERPQSNKDDDAEVLEPLDSGGTFDALENSSSGEPFLFSSFAADERISELQADNSDAIVDEGDGTYHIDENLSFSGLKLDMDFKKLVDSVLK